RSLRGRYRLVLVSIERPPREWPRVMPEPRSRVKRNFSPALVQLLQRLPQRLFALQQDDGLGEAIGQRRLQELLRVNGRHPGIRLQRLLSDQPGRPFHLVVQRREFLLKSFDFLLLRDNFYLLRRELLVVSGQRLQRLHAHLKKVVRIADQLHRDEAVGPYL